MKTSPHVRPEKIEGRVENVPKTKRVQVTSSQYVLITSTLRPSQEFTTSTTFPRANHAHPVPSTFSLQPSRPHHALTTRSVRSLCVYIIYCILLLCIQRAIKVYYQKKKSKQIKIPQPRAGKEEVILSYYCRIFEC